MSAAGPVTNHAAHLGTLVGPILLLAFWATWSELRAWLRREDTLQLPNAVLVGAALSVGAAVIHGIVIPPHLSESVLYGVFFAAMALGQLGWAVVAVVHPRLWVFTAGALGNLAIVALWGVTRTAGIPLGVAAGRREAIGVMDTTCCLLELGIVACCGWLAWSHEPAGPRVVRVRWAGDRAR